MGRRWTARIVAGRCELCLGYYDDPRQAHRAWRRAAKILFGEFAPHG